MILNAYAILDLFLVFLRLFLGLFVLWFAGRSWRRRFAEQDAEARQILEDRLYLLFLVALVLLGLIVFSWPLLYLLLQSYVDEWPGVMCIYGVTQIGAGSVGLSRFLPRLLAILQVAKPVLVFFSGAWFVMYLIDRQTETGPLKGRLLLTLKGLGLLAVADAVTEGAYLVIAKKAEYLSSGCCTEVFDALDRASQLLPRAIIGEDYRSWLYLAYYAVNLAMALGLFLCARSLLGRWERPALYVLFVGAAVSLAINWIFLIEILSPVLLRLPNHHCPYDLLPVAPDSVPGVALFILGSFAVGWAVWADAFARCPETGPFLDDTIRRILFLGLLGYLYSVILISLELYLA